jgi:hypothetical protein
MKYLSGQRLGGLCAYRYVVRLRAGVVWELIGDGVHRNERVHDVPVGSK